MSRPTRPVHGARLARCFMLEPMEGRNSVGDLSGPIGIGIGALAGLSFVRLAEAGATRRAGGEAEITAASARRSWQTGVAAMSLAPAVIPAVPTPRPGVASSGSIAAPAPATRETPTPSGKGGHHPREEMASHLVSPTAGQGFSRPVVAFPAVGGIGQQNGRAAASRGAVAGLPNSPGPVIPSTAIGPDDAPAPRSAFSSPNPTSPRAQGHEMPGASTSSADVTLAGTGSNPGATEEVLGSFRIRAAPSSARLVSGGTGFTGWINVMNQPVTYDDAFSGFNLEDRGFANLSSGSIVEMTFDPGKLTNKSGDDLLLLDARYSLNSYAVSTSIDNFAMEVAVGAADLTSTGVNKSYYYQLTGLTPAATVMAKAIDLTALGVPADQSVNLIRVRTTNGEADLLGVGSLNTSFDLDGKDAAGWAAYLDENAENTPGVFIQDSMATTVARLKAFKTGQAGYTRQISWDNVDKITVTDASTGIPLSSGDTLAESDGDKEYLVVASSTFAVTDSVTVSMQVFDGVTVVAEDRVLLRHVKVEVLNPIDTNMDSLLNDDANAMNGFVGNEFTFNTANPGVLTIQAQVRITPDIPEVRAVFQDRVRIRLGAIGTSHSPTGTYVTSLTWDHPFANEATEGNAVYDMATQLWTAEATFTGLPLNNSDFGRKTATITVMNRDGTGTFTEKTADYEVFWPLLIDPALGRVDSNFARNRPGPDLNAVQADFANTVTMDAARAPNWFYYWGQAIPEFTDQVRYGGNLAAVYGRTPALRHFANGYSGRADRTIIFELAAIDQDTLRGNVSGIDKMRNTVTHEAAHVRQVVEFTNEAFQLAVTGASLVTDHFWSFNIPRPAAVPVPPLPAGRVYNHFRDFIGGANGNFTDRVDSNMNLDFDDIREDEDMDRHVTVLAGRSGNDIPNWREAGQVDTPPSAPGIDVEDDAERAEYRTENGLAAQDWGNPGKNHNTISYID